MPQIIFVAGMSRAGSMWTYNVIRRLLESSGYKPLPESIPVDDQAAIQETIKRGPGKEGEWRNQLGPQQQKVLMELVTPWLRKYGFPL